MMKAARDYERGMDSLDVMLFDDGLEKAASRDTSPDEIVYDMLVLEKEAEDLSFELGVLSSRYSRSTDALCKVAEDLLRSGVPTTDLSRAVVEYMPRSELAKLALKQLSQRLSDLPATGVSKTAGSRVLRGEHPFCQALDKFASAALDYYTAAADADRLRGILTEARMLAKEAFQCSTK